MKGGFLFEIILLRSLSWFLVLKKSKNLNKMSPNHFFQIIDLWTFLSFQVFVLIQDSKFFFNLSNFPGMGKPFLA